MPFKDPERRRQYQRDWCRVRWSTDPAYAELVRARRRERYSTDPVFAESRRESRRRWGRANPDLVQISNTRNHAERRLREHGLI